MGSQYDKVKKAGIVADVANAQNSEHFHSRDCCWQLVEVRSWTEHLLKSLDYNLHQLVSRTNNQNLILPL